MKLTICQAGEAVLRRKARTLSRDEILGTYVQRLIESMRETMRDAPRVGLAAPQAGLPLQLVVIEDLPEYMQKIPSEELAERKRSPVPFHVLINPNLIIQPAEAAEFCQACL